MEFEEKSSSSYCEVYGAGNPNFLRSKASEAVEIEREREREEIGRSKEEENETSFTEAGTWFAGFMNFVTS